MSGDSVDHWLDRIPLSLREPYELAVEVLHGWGQVDGMFDLVSESVGNYAKDPVAEWIADRLLDLKSETVDLIPALDLVADEFRATGTPVEKLGGYYASSAHDLVATFTTYKWPILWAAIRREATDKPELKAIPDDLRWAPLTAADLLDHFEAVRAACLEPPQLSGDKSEKLDAWLEQEVCRAYDRRFDTQRSYPKDMEDSELDEVQWDEETEARNKWLYEQCWRIVPYSKIIRDLDTLCKEKGWDPIRSIPGIKRAANAYAKRKGKPRIPRRRSGRPRGRPGKM